LTIGVIKLNRKERRMPYLYLLIGIVDLILVFVNRDWAFTLAVVLGIIYVIFGLYEIFMPKK